MLIRAEVDAATLGVIELIEEIIPVFFGMRQALDISVILDAEDNETALRVRESAVGLPHTPWDTALRALEFKLRSLSPTAAAELSDAGNDLIRKHG